MLSPQTPVMNTIIFYIIAVILLIIIKPEIIYNNKTNEFKTFGSGENKTLLPFPVVCISIGIMLYMIFLLIKILYAYIHK